MPGPEPGADAGRRTRHAGSGFKRPTSLPTNVKPTTHPPTCPLAGRQVGRKVAQPSHQAVARDVDEREAPLLRQPRGLKLDDPAGALRLFKSNAFAGLVLFLALAAGAWRAGGSLRATGAGSGGVRRVDNSAANPVRLLLSAGRARAPGSGGSHGSSVAAVR